MRIAEILLGLDEILELSPGTLKGPESIKEWDSIAIISLIALADERFGKLLSVSQINSANTVGDIVALLMG